MEGTSRKKIIFGAVLIFATIFLTLGFSLAFFQYSRISDTISEIRTGEMMFGYIEQTNGISLENAVPMMDDTACSGTDENTYFDFYVTYSFPDTLSFTYEIDIEDITGEEEEVVGGALSSLDYSRIKVALENRTVPISTDSFVVQPTYFSKLAETPSSNEKAGYQLYEKATAGKATDYYRLYMWIPEYDSNGQMIPLIPIDSIAGIENQTFSVKINVQSDIQAK